MMNNSQQIKSKHYLATVDLLSDLPDPILCKILSLLPTKNAIATQILSTKWNTVSPFWATPITLDLDDSLLLNPIARKSKLPSISFMSFVDKLFNQTLVEVSQVQVFKLKCHKYYHVTKIASWVCNALRLNVRDLVFNIRLGRRSGVLFNILNGCTTLTSLELGKCFSVRVPDEFTLPNLKVLVLYKLVFGVYEEEDMLFNLIAGCPVLEDLCLDTCNLQHWGCVEIDSRMLKKLRMKDSWLDESSCELILEVPNLEVLLYDDCFAGSYDLCDLKSLVLAHIDVGLSEQEIDELGGDDSGTEEQGFWYANGVGMVVAACSSTIRLCLAARSISVLQRSSEQLPTFRNLTCLELGCMWRSEGWVLLGRLLCNAPCLEKLTIGEGFGTHEEGYSSFLSVLPNPPSCLEVHVREIEFWVFDEEEDEIKLVKYFLMHGKTIQKLSLRCLPFKKSRSCIRLNMLQKHSKIEFQPR